MKKLKILPFLFFVSCTTTIPKSENVPPTEKIVKQPEVVTRSASPGQVAKLELSKEFFKDTMTIVCGKKSIPLFQGEAYIPVSYFSKSTQIKCFSKDKLVAKIHIIPKKYKHERLNVDKKRVTLSKEDLKRVIREKKLLKSIYGKTEWSPFFENEFNRPLNSKITSQYGTKRIFNNKKHTQHLGTDFRAKIGTVIPAANDGKIVFSGDLFFTGNTIIVDHGMGIFTMYGHLNMLNRKTGDIVKKGEIIGHSGMTGRVNGPHLHWGVKVQGDWVDGFSLISETKGL